MNSPNSRSKSKHCYVVTDIDLIKFSRTEKQFLKWIQELERRIYKGNQRIIHGNGNTLYSCNVDQMKRMEAFITCYHEEDPKVIAQDRFVWSVFATDLIKRHYYHQVHSQGAACPTKLCLLLLLWSSYYLKLSIANQVQDLLREILNCTNNLKFIFSFLPGMSMTTYIFNFISKNCDETVLCDEFFVSIEENLSSSQRNVSMYQCYAPLILYFVENLVPFQSQNCEDEFETHVKREINCTLPLHSILDNAIVDKRKHTLLSLAVQYRDAPLVKLLLQIGASANIRQWDPLTEDFTTAEQLLITSVNSLVASKYFFASIADGFQPTILSIMDKIESVNACGIMMRRSLLIPESRKADNTWRGESWRQELNSEIADVWGIGYKRQLPSLRHIAKISIRQHILQVDKKLLPIAISKLPLPNMLKSYLNLMLD